MLMEALFRAVDGIMLGPRVCVCCPFTGDRGGAVVINDSLLRMNRAHQMRNRRLSSICAGLHNPPACANTFFYYAFRINSVNLVGFDTLALWVVASS